MILKHKVNLVKVINLFCRIKIPTDYLQKTIFKKKMQRIAGYGTVMMTCTLPSV